MSVSPREDFLTTGRENQKLRTRDALLDAAVALAREGTLPSIAEVAEAARVSNATAYRYFPNTEALWAAIAVRQTPPGGITDDMPADAEGRIDAIVRRFAAMQFGDETLWRGLARAALDHWFRQRELAEEDRPPVRGSSRLDGIRAAVEPLRGTLPPHALERLTMALTLAVGLDAMIVTRDTCRLEPDEATDLMSWAAQSLIRAAVAEAASERRDISSP
ncbi:MAG TPA: TetR family transcriptional regulator [Solirubrobacteraceae bacterium]|nr:TetR family transcriptional regulator [Solirubrobacteraceae bacterium]